MDMKGYRNIKMTKRGFFFQLSMALVFFNCFLFLFLFLFFCCFFFLGGAPGFKQWPSLSYKFELICYTLAGKFMLHQLLSEMKFEKCRYENIAKLSMNIRKEIVTQFHANADLRFHLNEKQKSLGNL